MLLLSKDKAIILEAQDYSDYTKLNEQIDIYDNLKNPDRWISETFTKPNGSVQTKEYLERDPYNEQIDKEISRLKKQIWTLKQKAMSNPIDQKSLGLVGNDIDQSDIKDYMDIVISTLKTSIEDDFSIALDDMPLDLQMQFIKFIKHANKAIIERTQKIGAVHQQNFYTSFLALAHGGPEMGDKILDIGEKLPENIAQKIFQKYADLVRINEKIVDFITDQYNTEISENPKIIEETRTKLFHKGIDILNNFHKRIPKDAPLLDEIYQNLESDLATLQAETFAKLSAFKYARKYGATYELSDIQNADLSVYTPQQLVQRGHHKRMRAIYEGNWKNAYDPKIYAELESIFMKSFDGSSDSEEKIISMSLLLTTKSSLLYVLKKKEDGTVYASALNVDPHKHGLSLGEVVMAQSLAKEAESHILDAKCIPTEMNSARYIEMGFVGHASENFQGIDIMHISWNKNKNEDLVSKKLSPLEIAQMAHGDIPTPETLRIYRADHQHDFHFLKDQGYVLSRYFKNKDGWYCVYESVNIDDYRSSEIDSD
ncbi:MAG: hypothetical protein LRY46_01620 [Candidatus Pacebacteria bacterium]|nr:hypothetical protein [Candidatus Paceibacterota bacterium]